MAPSPATAQHIADPLPDPGLTDSLGLVRSWFAHVHVGRLDADDRTVHLHTSRTRYFTVYRVNYQGRGLEFSERQVGLDGQSIGREEAKRRADTKVLELTELGYQPQLEVVELPESTLYVQTRLGVLQALDAYTGRTRWSRLVGRPGAPAVAPAADDSLVTTCTGSDLVWLDAQTGQVIYQRPTAKIPFGDLAISGTFVFLPTLDGTLEAYRHTDQYRSTPWRLHCEGTIRGAALVTDQHVAWLTDRGVLYVALADRTGVLYDVQFDGPGVGSPVRIAPGRIGVVTANGYVYAIDETNGAMIWRYGTGSDILATPLAVDGDLFVSTRTHGLFALSGQDGRLLWRIPEMDQALAVNPHSVYGTSPRGQLIRVDRARGEVVGRLSMPSLKLAVPNTQTDRLIVGTPRGLWMCLHDAQLPLPVVYVQRQEAQPPAPPTQAPAPPTPPAPEPPGGEEEPVNPFDQPGPFGAPAAGPPAAFPQPGSPPAGAPPAEEPPAEEPVDPFAGGLGPFAPPADGP